MSDRVDKLDDYIQTRYHQSIAELTDPRKQLHYSSSSDDVNTGPITLNRNPQFPSAPFKRTFGQCSAARSSFLDGTKDFGQSMQNTPMSLLDRVKRLEGQVFPGEATDTTASLPMQIKVLMNAVELSVVAPPRNNVASTSQQFNHQVAYNQPSYSQSSYSQQSQYQQQPQSQFQQQSQQQSQQEAQPEEQAQSKGHPFLKSLAKTLMTVGTMAASSMSYGGMGGMNNMGMGGMSGYNPMGYGGMPLNMGGGGPSGFMW